MDHEIFKKTGRLICVPVLHAILKIECKQVRARLLCKLTVSQQITVPRLALDVTLR